MKFLEKKFVVAWKQSNRKYLILVVLKNTINHLQKKNRIFYQPKSFENSNIIEINSVYTEHLKNSNKLSKTG